MYILFITIFICPILEVFAIQLNKIEPDKMFHDKRNSLIVKCNTTSYSKHGFLLYTFNGNNVTIPGIINNDTEVYYGNLTVTDPKQFRVNVVCLENVSFELIGTKIYFLGYPPNAVLIGNSTPKLTCQDFNLKRVYCCMSPLENQIAQLTGLVEAQSGHLQIKLINTQSEAVEQKLNNSCFNVTQTAFTNSLSFTLLISNDLGSQQYNFSYNRLDILKPETPILFLSEIDRILQLNIEMVDIGEFEINITCSSSSPEIIEKRRTKTVTKRVTIVRFTGWPPYSLVNCGIQSKIVYGHETKGNFSELSIVRYRMLESEPNIGPITSPALMTYESLDDGLLLNIVLYFLDLKLIDQNGIIINYKWNCENCFWRNDVRMDGNELIDKHSRSITISKAKIDSSVSITACTAVGCSKKWSKIYLIKLSDAELKERIYLIHNNNNNNNNNNWYLLWYLNNNSFVETSPSSDIPNTRKTQPSVLLCYKMQNETMNPENKCSSTELIPLYQYYGKIELTINNRRPIQFAFIKSFNNSPSKLSWFNCFYEKSIYYETALLKVRYDKYVSSEIDCMLSKCKVSLKIKIPPCTKLNTIIFEGIKVEYQTYTGYKNVSQYFIDRNEMRMLIFDLNSDENYDLKIFVITENNDIFWGTHTLYTSWYAAYKVVLIIIVVILVVCVSMFGIRKCYKRQTNHMFKKKFMSPSQRTLKNSSVKPLTLNNASDTSQFPQIGEANFTSSVFNSSSRGNQQYTDLTTIESTTDTSDSNYSVALSGEDTNEFHPNSDNSYITRPEQNKVPELYMTLVEVDPKNICETIHNEFMPHIIA